MYKTPQQVVKFKSEQEIKIKDVFIVYVSMMVSFKLVVEALAFANIIN